MAEKTAADLWEQLGKLLEKRYVELQSKRESEGSDRFYGMQRALEVFEGLNEQAMMAADDDDVFIERFREGVRASMRIDCETQFFTPHSRRDAGLRLALDQIDALGL